jgi:hypothetical protein
MESVEAEFEEILVTEAEGAGEQAADFAVDAFHFSAGEPGFVIAQDPLGMAKEGLGHRMELPDAAGFCLGAPFAQEPPGRTSIFLLPEFSELFLENSSPVVVLSHRGTLTLSITGLSPMDTLRTVRQRYPCRRSFCPAGTSGSFSGSTSKMISPPS